MTTKVTIETEYRTAIVETKETDVDLHEIVELFKEALVGAGFTATAIKEYFAP